MHLYIYAAGKVAGLQVGNIGTLNSRATADTLDGSLDARITGTDGVPAARRAAGPASGHAAR